MARIARCSHGIILTDCSLSVILLMHQATSRVIMMLCPILMHVRWLLVRCSPAVNLIMASRRWSKLSTCHFILMNVAHITWIPSVWIVRRENCLSPRNGGVVLCVRLKAVISTLSNLTLSIFSSGCLTRSWIPILVIRMAATCTSIWVK